MPTIRCSFAILAPVLLLAQHEKEGEKSKHPFIGDPAAIEAGRKLFATGCAACHGPEAQGGRGPNLRERTSWHPLDDPTLYSVVQKGIPNGGMPPASLPENQAWQLVAFVRALTAPAIETPLPAGDAKAGEDLFWGSAGCGNCHKIRGRGGALGPDLSDVGAARAAGAIREAIVDPDANGSRGYEAAEVHLKNGKSVRGVARNRSNYDLQVLDRDGNLHLLAMSEVSDLKLSKTSPMPKDYGKRLAKSDIDNLLAYLSRQSVRPVEPKSARKPE